MYGKYKHTVDPKGRLFVPSKLRDELGEAFFLRHYNIDLHDTHYYILPSRNEIHHFLRALL